MSLVAKIFSKDLHRLWPLAGFAVTCSLLDQVLLAQGGFAVSTTGTPISVINLALSACKWPAFFIYAILLVHEDAITPERPFWKTHPISRGALAASKIGSLLLVVAAPTAIGRMYALFHLGVPPLQAIELVCESTVVVTSSMAFVALGASLTKSIVEFAIGSLALVAAIVVIISISELHANTKIPFPWDNSVQETGPRLLATETTLLIGSLSLLAFHYASLRTLWTRIGLLVVLGVALIVGNRWTRGTAEGAFSPSTQQLTPKEAPNFQAQFEKEKLYRGHNSNEAPRLSTTMEVHGLVGGQEIEISEIDAKIAQEGRESISLKQDRATPLLRSESDTLRWLGEPELAAEARAVRAVQEQLNFKNHLDLPIGYHIQGTTTAEARVAHYQDSIVFRMPLRLGETRAEAGQRWVVRAISYDSILATGDDDGLNKRVAANIVLNVTRPTSLLIPNSPFARPWGYDPTFAILCPKTGTYTFAIDSTGGTINELSGFRVMTVALKIVGVFHHGVKVPASSLDPAWFDGAEFVALRLHRQGETTVRWIQPIAMSISPFQPDNVP